jgi:hypothetical protein
MGNEVHMNKLWYVNLEGGGHLKAVGIGRRIILNGVLMK